MSSAFDRDTAAALLRDWRTPASPMATLPVKLPDTLMAALDHWATTLGTSRGALARGLIAKGLEQLGEATTATEVA